MTEVFLIGILMAAAVPAHALSPEDSALEALHSDDPAARAAACVALATAPTHGPSVYGALALAMDRDLSERVRLAAGKAVITFPGDDPLKRVLRFFQSEPGPQNRIDLTVALSTAPSRLEDTGVTDLISSLLAEDPSAEVRGAAALALARRGDTRALPAVRLAAEKDADKSVRDAARRALKLLSAPRPAPPKAKPWQPTPPKSDAVKGKDPCPAPWGWCECDGPIKLAPKCLTRSECRVELDTAIGLGMPCTWNGLSIGTPE